MNHMTTGLTFSEHIDRTSSYVRPCDFCGENNYKDEMEFFDIYEKGVLIETKYKCIKCKNDEKPEN